MRARKVGRAVSTVGIFMVILLLDSNGEWLPSGEFTYKSEKST